MLLSKVFKVFEGRINKGSIKNLTINQIIFIRCKTEVITVKIKNIRLFSNFKDLLCFNDNSLMNTLPYVNSLEEGILLYHSIYKIENIIQYGTVSIELELI
jgi:ASC-1-like (ASCH) protein